MYKNSFKVNLIIMSLLLVGSVIMAIMSIENRRGIIACFIGLWCTYLIYGLIGNIVAHVKEKKYTGAKN